MGAREIVEEFWRDMQANDFRAAGAHLAPDCVVQWPVSGEQFVGPDGFATVQETYPCSSGRWGFEIHRIVAEDTRAVSEVTVSDGAPAARVIAFFETSGDLVTSLTEYWPAFYAPPMQRPDVMSPGPRVP